MNIQKAKFKIEEALEHAPKNKADIAISLLNESFSALEKEIQRLNKEKEDENS